jgi:hypothetical protein
MKGSQRFMLTRGDARGVPHVRQDVYIWHVLGQYRRHRAARSRAPFIDKSSWRLATSLSVDAMRKVRRACAVLSSHRATASWRHEGRLALPDAACSSARGCLRATNCPRARADAGGVLPFHGLSLQRVVYCLCAWHTWHARARALARARHRAPRRVHSSI